MLYFMLFSIVQGVLEGYNGTIFAYGQTGCGKSFSMQGITDPATQRGIIPRAFEHIFENIQVAENVKFLVRASYLEIYNEEIRDLLGKEHKTKMELKEHPDKGVYVKGLYLKIYLFVYFVGIEPVGPCKHTHWSYNLINNFSIIACGARRARIPVNGLGSFALIKNYFIRL